MVAESRLLDSPQGRIRISAMFLKKIQLKNFRNYSDLFVEFQQEGACFCGSNGSGKTNLLEAIHMLCTGKSQRNSRKEEMVNFASPSASIKGEFLSQARDKNKAASGRIDFNRDSFIYLARNGKKVASFSEWFGTQAIISFAPNDSYIVEGNSAQRRRFLDMLLSTQDRVYLTALIAYRKNLFLRNKLLKSVFDTILCEIYEEKMAEYGSIIVQKRAECLDEISPVCTEIYREISAFKDTVSVAYAPSIKLDSSRKNAWKEVFLTMLAERRIRDREMGFSLLGPHRDELLFFINGKPASGFASQGQCRSLVLSIKLSSMACIEKKVIDSMIIVFDDAVSELDPERAGRVFALLEGRGQLFIASPSKSGPQRTTLPCFAVADGRVSIA